MNLIRYIRNWSKLRYVQRTVNENRIYKESKLKLNYKPLLNYPVLNVLDIKVNGMSLALLVYSQRNIKSGITYIDYIWLNKKTTVNLLPETESSYYQVLYEVFMRWYGKFVLQKECDKTTTRRVAISINVTKEDMIERFRRILTIYGFEMDTNLTIEGIDFNTPWRDKEKITQVIYSRVI